MATYEDIEKANATIKTTDIKGKEYAEVNQRIKAFRMVYPDGAIHTEMLANENGVCVIKASVFASGTTEYLLGTGHAYEKEGSGFINKTSYIENCETSAVGRALGMAGFGIDTNVASYEEVANAKKNQGESDIMERMNKADDTPISDSHAELLKAKAEKLGIDIAGKYGKNSITELTEGEYGRAMNALASLRKDERTIGAE